MEEILASIRRIISEDEASTEQPSQSASASQEDDEHLELVEGEADDKIIHDIARVLSGGAPRPVEEPAEDSAAEDINTAGEVSPDVKVVKSTPARPAV
jgi:cell pole-organizing protein PopZ